MPAPAVSKHPSLHVRILTTLENLNRSPYIPLNFTGTVARGGEVILFHAWYIFNETSADIAGLVIFLAFEY